MPDTWSIGLVKLGEELPFKQIHGLEEEIARELVRPAQLLKQYSVNIVPEARYIEVSGY